MKGYTEPKVRNLDLETPAQIHLRVTKDLTPLISLDNVVQKAMLKMMHTPFLAKSSLSKMAFELILQ